MQSIKSLLENKKILIAGFGREGRSSYNTIRRLLPQQIIAIADKNTALEKDETLVNDCNIILYLGDNYLDAADNYNLILKSPGIPTFDFEGKITDFSKISSQTDIFLQIYQNQIVGITGTKGKSTTTNLIYKVLSSAFDHVIMAGNMGIPLFDTLEKINPQSIIVLELSSHQLENVHVSPHVSVLLNLFQEHLDHYHSYKDYQLAKMNIAKFQTKNDYFVYCADNELVVENIAEQNLKTNLLPYSLDKTLTKGCCCKNDFLILKPCNTEIYDVTQKRYLQGNHNLLNIMATFLVAQCFDISSQETSKAVAQFKGLEHRMEFVCKKNNIEFYNDSISTIPEACISAVDALQKVDTLILGGFDRGINYSHLANFLIQSKIRNFVFVGKAGNRIFQLMKNDLSTEKNILQSSDYKQIVKWCFENTMPQKICLLSPAAASYDQFKNFEERGRFFKQQIEEYK